MRTLRRRGSSRPRPVDVRSLMSGSIVTIDPRVSLTAAAAEMRANRIGSVLVLGEGSEIAGILTERDLMRALADGRNPGQTHVSEYMTQSPHTIEAGRDAAYGAALMVRHHLRHLPVLEGGRPVGLLSARDLLAMEPWPKALPPLEPW